MNDEVKVKELRLFGLMLGGVLGLIAFWPLVRHGEALRLWAAGLATISLALGLAAPRSLTSVYRHWRAVGHVLGRINTSILLGIVFFGIVTPIALVARIVRSDPLRRTFEPRASSYRVLRSERKGEHLYRPY